MTVEITHTAEPGDFGTKSLELPISGPCMTWNHFEKPIADSKSNWGNNTQAEFSHFHIERVSLYNIICPFLMFRESGIRTVCSA